ETTARRGRTGGPEPVHPAAVPGRRTRPHPRRGPARRTGRPTLARDLPGSVRRPAGAVRGATGPGRSPRRAVVPDLRATRRGRDRPGGTPAGRLGGLGLRRAERHLPVRR